MTDTDKTPIILTVDDLKTVDELIFNATAAISAAMEEYVLATTPKDDEGRHSVLAIIAYLLAIQAIGEPIMHKLVEMGLHSQQVIGLIQAKAQQRQREKAAEMQKAGKTLYVPNEGGIIKPN